MHGYGVLTYANGKIAYQGNWKNDQFSDHGVLSNQNPKKLSQPLNYQNMDDIIVDQVWVQYDGTFQNDAKNGYGHLIFSNGEKYIGNFKNDQIHGAGVFYRMDGAKITGRWVHNRFVN